jgi:sec-independent protein translocase protein TatC
VGARRPGLYKHEKRLAVPLIASSVVMFGLGMAYCYFVVFGFVFKFIAGFAPMSVNVSPDIEAYFSFVMGMFLAFGMTFEVRSSSCCSRASASPASRS